MPDPGDILFTEQLNWIAPDAMLPRPGHLVLAWLGGLGSGRVAPARLRHVTGNGFQWFYSGGHPRTNFKVKCRVIAWADFPLGPPTKEDEHAT